MDGDAIAGVHDRTKPPNSISMQFRKFNEKHASLHPEFKPLEQPFFEEDIALISLQKAFDFNEFVRPICLPSPNKIKDMGDKWDGSIVNDGEQLTIIGFGYTDETKEIPGKLQYADVTKLNPNKCYEDWYAGFGKTETIFPDNWNDIKTKGFCFKGKNEEVFSFKN